MALISGPSSMVIAIHSPPAGASLTIVMTRPGGAISVATASGKGRKANSAKIVHFVDPARQFGSGEDLLRSMLVEDDDSRADAI